MKLYYLYILYVLCITNLSYSCEPEKAKKESHGIPTRLIGFFVLETPDCPPLGSNPKTKKVFIQATPLLRVKPPLAYEKLAINLSTEKENFAFKPGKEIKIRTETVTREFCGLRFANREEIPVIISRIYTEKPYYAVLPFFSHQKLLFKPAPSS